MKRSNIKTVGAVVSMLLLGIILGSIIVLGLTVESQDREILKLQKERAGCMIDYIEATEELTKVRAHSLYIQTALYNVILNSSEFCAEEHTNNTNSEWAPLPSSLRDLGDDVEEDVE